MKQNFRINQKLIVISITFMFIFIAATSFLITIIFDNNINLMTTIHFNQTTLQLEKEIDLLKSTTKKIADNEKIVEIMDENRLFNQLDYEEVSIIMEQINLYEQNFELSKFVDTVNIISLSGNYLFSKGKVYEDFKLSDRPWFKEEHLNRGREVFLTELHSDYNTKKETIGIVSFIYSKDNNELLGAAILDVFVDELLSELETGFYIGDLEASILPSNYDIDSLNKENSNKYCIKYAENILSNDTGILFLFNKESIKEYSVVKSIVITTKIIVVLIGLIIAISLIISIRTAFSPAIQSINKLKNLIKNLGEEDNEIKSLDNMDEFKQLEAISQVIGKTFDNKIQSLIYHDGLTGLPNRKKLSLICNYLIKEKKGFALIFIDLNRFKKVNDIFGHTVGDKLLVSFSNIIKVALGDRGELIRYSGDEFIIVYKEYQNDLQLIDFYENEILPKFSASININKEVNLKIEFSCGVAVYPRDGLDLEELVNKSDFMMYTSKGNNEPYKLLFFNGDIYKDMMYIETLKNELKNSIENNELYLFYQPIFDSNKSIVKAEALLRWNSRVLGNVGPDRFIKYAEETREIIPIGYWIIEKVCKVIDKNKFKIAIGINISPIQLMENDFFEKVNQLLNKYNIQSNKIYFEITESVLLDESEVVKQNVLNLRKSGIAIALDDFGTGYSSFSYLKKYKLDILKIDKLFIDNISLNELAIVGYIKEISNLLDMKVVIEGVENEEQFNELKKIGCEFFQGYYFSKPIEESLLMMLEENNCIN